MSIISKFILILRRTVALVLLPLLACSCQLVVDDYDCETDISDARQYINVTISISASETPATRANPNGGENGDGQEKGIDTRENEVDGVTLIFFQDPANTTAGINATVANAEATTIDCAVYYTVTRDDSHASAHPTGHTDEVFYTTGDRELDLTLDPSNTYHLLVVANADLTGNITVGTTTLAQLRDMTLSSVYNTGTGIGTTASKFVMSSEKDHTIDFSSSIYDATTNRLTFNLDNVHMERMAARIDFSTEYGSYDVTLGGYKYYMGDNGDVFVLTKVTPFNLYNENEFVFKRVQDTWSGTPTTTYLGDETMTSNKADNYVVDPKTHLKDNDLTSHPFSLLSPIAASMNDEYSHSMTTAQSSPIIICYMKENTLMPTSHLKKYATGIAFEGKYYTGSIGATPENRTYYHYLRHQGESDDSYLAKQWGDLSDTEISTADTPMNIGIVRNNIYRISIKGGGQGTLKIKIEETKWRHVDNPIIYL